MLAVVLNKADLLLTGGYERDVPNLAHACLIRMRAVVLDEADLLLTGGYERDAKRILGALREGDRATQAGAAAAKIGMPAGALAALPRHMRRAAAEGGDTLFLFQSCSCTSCGRAWRRMRHSLCRMPALPSHALLL